MKCASATLALALLGTASAALAQTTLDYRSAEAAMARQPSSASAAEADVRAAEHQAAATANPYRPTVTLSASVIAYEKSLNVDLTGPKERFVTDANGYLTALPSQFPPGFSDIVALVAGRVSQAVPGLLAPIPDQYDYNQRDVVVRPNLTAVMPLYTGGALESVRDSARAQVTMAKGAHEVALGADAVRLAQSYFGVQLAAELVASGQETLQSAEGHLANVVAMHREGVVARSLVLEATVARDAALRALERAQRDETMARNALARLTGVSAARPITPLFVNTDPLPPPTQWTAASQSGQQQLAQGTQALAAAGELAARATIRPTAFAFGSINAVRKQSLPIDPDWIAGVTVRVPLISPVSRRELIAAAEARSEAARLRALAVDERVAGEISDSHQIADNARRAFLSMDSSLAAARENLRVKTVAFREGMGTSAEVTDAQTALALARAQRATAAYEYDLALAALLAASGQNQRFADYAEAPDRRTIR